MFTLFASPPPTSHAMNAATAAAHSLAPGAVSLGSAQVERHLELRLHHHPGLHVAHQITRLRVSCDESRCVGSISGTRSYWLSLVGSLHCNSIHLPSPFSPSRSLSAQHDLEDTPSHPNPPPHNSPSSSSTHRPHRHQHLSHSQPAGVPLVCEPPAVDGDMAQWVGVRLGWVRGVLREEEE